MSFTIGMSPAHAPMVQHHRTMVMPTRFCCVESIIMLVSNPGLNVIEVTKFTLFVVPTKPR